jgi:hypothetical protein
MPITPMCKVKFQGGSVSVRIQAILLFVVPRDGTAIYLARGDSYHRGGKNARYVLDIRSVRGRAEGGLA